MKASELRIGNILNYHTAEGDILPIVIDWQSLKWISEDPKGFNLVHSPIPLTEEILLKCGFIKCEDFDDGGLIDYRYELHLFNGSISFTSNWSTEDSIYVNLNQCGTDVFYLHQLQNLYHALTGEELTVNF